MSVCPRCKNEELEEVTVCSRCGSLLDLEGLETDETLTFSGMNSDEMLELLERIEPRPQEPAKDGDEARVALFLIDNDSVLDLSGKSEFTLGRVIEGHPAFPDLDLTAFEAYAQGVSRQHAIVRIIQEQVIILDLNSSNGTRVNGQKIIPHVEYPLQDGDIVALGKLRLQVIIH